MLTVEERLAKLEQENRKLKQQVDGLNPRDDTLDRIMRVGSSDQGGLPSATAQIKTGNQFEQECEDKEFADALESVTGSSTALREGFRKFDDHREGGYDFRVLQKVSQKLDRGTIPTQQILERAARSLPKE
ncbi:MAG: hypothetical protein ABSA41_17070 [Terriglobia bacterium]|jgi:hypothetical protein